MTRSRSQVVTLVLEADEDGNLDLVDCFDLNGSRKPYQPSGLTDVGWVMEDWANSGTDMLVDRDDELRMSARLVVRGYSWCDGPDYNGEYDGGFEVVEVVERKPMIQRKARDGKVIVNDCPECKMTHTFVDDGSQKQVFDCSGEVVVVCVESSK